MAIFNLLSCQNKAQEKQEYMAIYQKYYQGQIEESALLLSEFIKKYPNNHNAWTFYGVVESQLMKDSIAEIAFNKALEINPNIKQALTGLGVIYRTQGKFDQAEQLYQKSLEIDPNFPEAYSSLVLIELNKINYEKAIEYGKKALELDNTNSVFAANLAVAYHFNSNLELRDEMFQKSKALGYDQLDVEIVEAVFEGRISLEEMLNQEP